MMSKIQKAMKEGVLNISKNYVNITIVLLDMKFSVMKLVFFIITTMTNYLTLGKILIY